MKIIAIEASEEARDRSFLFCFEDFCFAPMSFLPMVNPS
jgi:hypothetical protein